MRLCLLIALPLVSLAFSGCKTPYKESDEKREADRRDAAPDPNFQAFVGRLRKAVENKDYEMLQGMMAPDFGYRWDDAPPGDNVFTYWSMNNLWPVLTDVLRKPFIPNGPFMVAPPDFVSNPAYPGYRAGMRQLGGSWRFVYFVPPPPAAPESFDAMPQ
jgi:hypothetical protein